MRIEEELAALRRERDALQDELTHWKLRTEQAEAVLITELPDDARVVLWQQSEFYKLRCQKLQATLDAIYALLMNERGH